VSLLRTRARLPRLILERFLIRASIQPTGSTDVAVVGAGPAGAICALELARHGVSVVLLERETVPRYKACGGGLVGRTVRHLAGIPGIENTIERRCTRALLAFASDGLEFRVERSEPLVTMTMRDRFDAALVGAAVEAGAELMMGTAVTALERGAEHIQIDTDRGSLRARMVVGADGARSTTAQAAGFADPPRLIPALEYELVVEENIHERFRDLARFDFGFVDRGYAWVFPKRHHLSVGILSLEPPRPGLPRRLEAYLRSLAIGDVRCSQRHGHVIPFAPRRAPWARDGVLLAGDAAGFADPVTAEGISFALWSGRLAASAILEEGDSAANYTRKLESTLLRELRAARWLARILYGWRPARRFAFRRYGRRLCEAVTDVMLGHSSYRALLNHPKSYLALRR
jgi:geranylgeranyl reductase family protein